MNEQVEAKLPEVAEGYTAEEISTKAKQEDGTHKVFKGVFAKPTASSIVAMLTGDNKDLKAQVEDCFLIGYSARIRNHLVSGRAAAYPVVTPTDVIKMAAEALESRGGSGEALALNRELVGLIVSVAAAAGISSKGCATVRKLVSSAAGLKLASQTYKDKVVKLLEATSGAMTDEGVAHFEAPLSKLIDAATSEPDTEDDDF